MWMCVCRCGRCDAGQKSRSPLTVFFCCLIGHPPCEVPHQAGRVLEMRRRSALHTAPFRKIPIPSDGCDSGHAAALLSCCRFYVLCCFSETSLRGECGGRAGQTGQGKGRLCICIMQNPFFPELSCLWLFFSARSLARCGQVAIHSPGTSGAGKWYRFRYIASRLLTPPTSGIIRDIDTVIFAARVRGTLILPAPRTPHAN
jgi:hypothetical protein